MSADTLIITDQRKKIRLKNSLHLPEIIIKQLLKYSKVMERRRIDASIHRPYDLTGGAVGIFIAGQKIGQIVLPEIPLKSVADRQFYKAVHHVRQKSGQILPVVILIFIFFHQKDHILQKLAFLHILI